MDDEDIEKNLNYGRFLKKNFILLKLRAKKGGAAHACADLGLKINSGLLRQGTGNFAKLPISGYQRRQNIHFVHESSYSGLMKLTFLTRAIPRDR